MTFPPALSYGGHGLWFGGHASCSRRRKLVSIIDNHYVRQVVTSYLLENNSQIKGEFEMIDFDQDVNLQDLPVVSIKVVGVGGAGGNTVNSIIDSGYNFIECLVVNTDAQALSVSKADIKIQLGIKSTKGMGAGANPELGKRAAEEDLSKVMDALEGSDIVFLAGGMGGGTGSGALPVIARALKECGILSIAVVTKPFEFEGKRRARVAQEAIELLAKEVDTLLIIPNQKLLDVTDKNISMIDAFTLINNVLSQSVKGISEIMTSPGHINVDFADVKAIMKNTGIAVMGSGTASGQSRAVDAALMAISSPLLEDMSIQGATGVLLNITGDKSLGLHEIGAAANIIYEQVSEDANIILGSVIDPTMGDKVTVTIIATGFGSRASESISERKIVQENKISLENKAYLESRVSQENKVCIEPVINFEIKSCQEHRTCSENSEHMFQGSSKIEQEIVAKKEDNIFEREITTGEAVVVENAANIENINNIKDIKNLEHKISLIEECDGKKESVDSGLNSHNTSNISNISNSSDLDDLNNLGDINDLDVPSFMRKSI